MAYYVAIDSKDRYLVKNVKDSGFFGMNFQYKEGYACTLEEIDSYTSKFKNEGNLKKCLISERIIKADEEEMPLVIIHIDGFLDKNGSMGRKIYGNILMGKSNCMIKDTFAIVKYIEERISDRDLLFFEELYKIIPNDSNLKSAISRIGYAVMNLVSDGSFETVGVDFLNEILLVDKETNYEVYHNVVSFIADYDEYLSKNKENNKVKTKKQ